MNYIKWNIIKYQLSKSTWCLSLLKSPASVFSHAKSCSLQSCSEMLTEGPRLKPHKKPQIASVGFSVGEEMIISKYSAVEVKHRITFNTAIKYLGMHNPFRAPFLCVYSSGKEKQLFKLCPPNTLDLLQSLQFADFLLLLILLLLMGM